LERPAALGRSPEEPPLTSSLFAGNHMAFNADVVCGLAGQFLGLAEK
jgi:hypothetical protein